MESNHERNLPVKVDEFRLFEKARASFPKLIEGWGRQLELLDPKAPGAELVAAEISGQVTKAEKLADHMAKTEAAPLKDALDTVRSWWKPIMVGLDAMRTEAKNKAALALHAHRERQRKEREAAEEALLEARKKEQAAEAARFNKATVSAGVEEHKEALRDLRATRATLDSLPPPGAPTAIRTESGTLFPREDWGFEVVKLEDVPRDYLEVSKVAVNNAIAAGVREIPGLRISATTTMVQRGRG